ncbi:MAG TPA: LytTR family DNA-binding domain-containing protein [Bryobacteraceae bacterium]|nr:LytTR family DNA-binding domain-containing protein [Bryobacteraceae bacterium]
MPTRATSITTVVIDDEKLALEELLYLLKDYPDVEVVGSADNGIQGVEIIEKMEPDVVFLDVQMPGLDGIGVIRKLRENTEELPYFVLVTAYDNYAIEAFRMEALDYLLKPVEKSRLDQTIQRAQRLFADQRAGEPVSVTPRPKEQRTKILVKSAGRSFIVDAQDIVYATIDEGVITIVTSSVEGESNYKTIEELQSNLDPETFWRVHRSYLVNINRIREVIPWFKSSYQIRMDDKKQTEIPVSRVQTKRLRSLLKL